MSKKLKISDVFTIPNILSLVRLAMIPFIVWLYCVKDDAVMTAVLLIASGATDVVDGFIARSLNMIREIGKALDPVADKCTQLATLLCLVTKYKRMLIPFVMLLVKELVNGTVNLISARRNKRLEGADWHGKLSTVFLYAMLVLHVLWIKTDWSTLLLLIWLSVPLTVCLRTKNRMKLMLIWN